MSDVKLFHGDCLDVLKNIPDNSIDSIVTDPPYGISFMGKKWDYDIPSVEVWKECLRVLKPGGHLVAFAGTRTQHRMCSRIEDAGFEIRDMLAWLYGSGFPKSHNIGKAVDKIQGNERTKVENPYPGRNPNPRNVGDKLYGSDLRTDDNMIFSKGTSQWEGFGTALKPALEPITLARKPISENTIAENVLKWGTGAINIDVSRIEHNVPKKFTKRIPKSTGEKMGMFKENGNLRTPDPSGRFPANIIHDGSDEVLEIFPETKSGSFSGHRNLPKTKNSFGKFKLKDETPYEGSTGSAARFFYCAKASRKDRDEGLEDFESKQTGSYQFRIDSSLDGKTTAPSKNTHNTVKPTDLMRYLCRLITPPEGVILDPFMGSGSAGKAARLEGFSFVGIEMQPDYFDIAKARIDAVTPPNSLDKYFAANQEESPE